MRKPYHDPWECTDPGVVTGTSCLPNTSGRCTWCGRILPRPPRQTRASRYRAAASAARQAGRQVQDPIEYLSDGTTPDYWTMGEQ